MDEARDMKLLYRIMDNQPPLEFRSRTPGPIPSPEIKQEMAQRKYDASIQDAREAAEEQVSWHEATAGVADPLLVSSSAAASSSNQPTHGVSPVAPSDQDRSTPEQSSSDVNRSTPESEPPSKAAPGVAPPMHVQKSPPAKRPPVPKLPASNLPSPVKAPPGLPASASLGTSSKGPPPGAPASRASLSSPRRSGRRRGLCASPRPTRPRAARSRRSRSPCRSSPTWRRRESSCSPALRCFEIECGFEHQVLSAAAARGGWPQAGPLRGGCVRARSEVRSRCCVSRVARVCCL